MNANEEAYLAYPPPNPSSGDLPQIRKTVTLVKLFMVKKFIPTNEPALDGNEWCYLQDCLKNNWISFGGKYSKLFEERFASYLGIRYAIAVSSGTAAIHLALLSLGIGPGDEVIIPDFTIIVSASMTILTGAKPVLVDVDRYGCLDPEKIEENITSRTKAIMVVHMYGVPANIERIIAIAKKHKLYVIEDACAAYGTEIYMNNSKRRRKAGTVGDIGSFSLYGTKTITAGEGGMVVTNSEKIAAKVRLLSNQAFESPRFVHRFLGFNYRMNDLQAALALAQLERIEEKVKRKREISTKYNKLLKNISEVTIPTEPSWGRNGWWVYPILINQSFGRSRDDVIALLSRKGIGSERFFTPMSQQPVFSEKDFRYPTTVGSFPVSHDLSRRGMYIPTGIKLTDTDQKLVIRALLSLRVS